MKVASISFCPADCPEQTGSFIQAEISPFTRLQPAERDMHDSFSVQRHYPITERLTHTSNLTIPSLREDDAKAASTEPVHATGTSKRTEDLDALRHLLEERLVECPVHFDPIFPFMPMLHPQDIIHDITVVGQQDQPRGVLVQAADRENPGGKVNFTDDVP